jgi:hypothetical protein
MSTGLVSETVAHFVISTGACASSAVTIPSSMVVRCDMLSWICVATNRKNDVIRSDDRRPPSVNSSYWKK